MKLVYIAGSYTGDNAWEVEQNVRRAEELSLAVARSGIMPVCPHTQSRFFFGQCDEPFWLDGTMELMRRCDAVLVVPHSENSKGTIGEIEEAYRLRIPVFKYVESVIDSL